MKHLPGDGFRAAPRLLVNRWSRRSLLRQTGTVAAASAIIPMDAGRLFSGATSQPKQMPATQEVMDELAYRDRSIRLVQMDEGLMLEIDEIPVDMVAMTDDGTFHCGLLPFQHFLSFEDLAVAVVDAEGQLWVLSTTDEEIPELLEVHSTD